MMKKINSDSMISSIITAIVMIIFIKFGLIMAIVSVVVIFLVFCAIKAFEDEFLKDRVKRKHPEEYKALMGELEAKQKDILARLKELDNE